MDREQATMAVGYLCAGTTGWNDEAVLVYVAEFEKLRDVEALQAAVNHIVSTWREARRPPVATVLDAYRSEMSRRQTVPSLSAGRHRVVPPSEGVEIARRAYAEECRRLGREPNFDRFDRIVGSVAR